VNLTDGLDGLAISVTFIAMTALTGFTYLSSDARWSGYLDLTHRPESGMCSECGASVNKSLEPGLGRRPADFDKDGFIDLAVPSRDGGQSQIYFNDGKARFNRTAPFGPPNASARVGAAADFNGDGSTDLVVGDERAASMVVYLNDGKGGLTAGFQIADRTKVPYAIASGDLNNDGSPDIVLGYTSGPHTVFFNDGSGRQFTQVRFGDPAGSAYGFALGDVNGDKFADIALARSDAPNVLYLSGK